MFAEVDPLFVERRIDNRSGFSTSGQVRAIEVRQLLRAAQVGGLPDARLELNAYALLARLGRSAGPWIAESIELAGDSAPAPHTTTMAELAERPPRRVFEQVSADSSTGFLELRCAEFRELDATGSVVARAVREYVVPRPLSINTVCVAALRNVGGEVMFGLVDRDLPASQAFDGNSALLVAPAWRMPADVRSTTPARQWLRERLAREHGLASGQAWELGGRYHPSAGVTPEVVYPLALEVTSIANGADVPVIWVSLRDAVDNVDALVDGHTRIVALRAAHALGLL